MKFTKEDLEKQIGAITKEVQKEYEAANEAYLQWTEGDPRPKFCSARTIKSEAFLYYSSPDSMIEMLEEFKQEVAELPYHIGGTYDLCISAYGYSDGAAEIDDNHFGYTYWTRDTEVKDFYINGKIREWINLNLKPDSVQYSRPVDCKLLTLFKEGAIDFDTLQKLVYTDCKL